MKQKNKVKSHSIIFITYFIQILVCIICLLGYVMSPKGGFLELQIWQYFLLMYIYTLPIATGIAGIGQMVTTIFKKINSHSKISICCGVFGMLIVFAYIVERMGVLVNTSLNRLDNLTVYICTIAIWCCWIIELIIHFKTRRNKLHE